VGKNPLHDFIDFEKEKSQQSTEAPLIEVKEEDIATIVYTAGTTGKPKGVVATHKNWVWESIDKLFASWSSFYKAQKVLNTNPLFHSGGFLNLFWSFFPGQTIVLLTKAAPKNIFQWIEKEKVERVHTQPTVYAMMLQFPDIQKYDLSSVKLVGSGGERMPEETRNQLENIFPGAGIYELYGLTEECGTATVRLDRYTKAKPSSVGRSFLFEEIRIVDEQGKDVPVGEVGEVILRCPHMMKEYYKDPEKTANAIRGGWLYTDDLGRLDEDGFLYINERKKNMIVSGGENIYPKEVEDVLLRHPKIVEVAVFGVPDKVWGERICAAIVLENGKQMTADEVIGFCKQNIASFKKPKSVYFVNSLPKSPMNKVLRSELKKMFQN